jgi:hypothetical protein
MKKQILALAVLAALSALTAPLATTAAAQSSDFRWSGALPHGQTIEIRGVNGDVRALPASDGTVRVEATKSARRDDPGSVRIEVVEHADGVTICAVYPTPASARRDNQCRPGGGGQSVQNNDVRVDFVVRVPAGVVLTASTVNGGVEAEGLHSDVRASTVNGGVRVSTSGFAQASTVNGSVVARLGQNQIPGRASYSTVNGSVTLEMPAGLNAELRASTVNGSIDSDFPITVQGRMSRRSLRGTIGAGGPQLDVSTVNGSIILRQS